MRIGVFDSGVGGLTVAKEIMQQIPNNIRNEILSESIKTARFNNDNLVYIPVKRRSPPNEGLEDLPEEN